MSAHYTLPVFNLQVNIWRSTSAITDPPDVVTVGNLALGRRSGTLLVNTASSGNAFGGMWLLCPKQTDIRDGKSVTGSDQVEVPAGSGRMYLALWVDDVAGGFANEHRFAELLAVAPWPSPLPSPSPPIPPPPGAFPFYTLLPPPTSIYSTSFTWITGEAEVWLFQANVSGNPPSLYSSSYGSILPTQQFVGPAAPGGCKGIVYYWRYTPAAGTETLQLTNGDFNSGSVFVGRFPLSSPRLIGNQNTGDTTPIDIDMTNPLGTLCQASIGICVNNYSLTSEGAWSVDYTKDGLLVAVGGFFDTNGDAWNTYLMDGTSLGGGVQPFTWSWGASVYWVAVGFTTT